MANFPKFHGITLAAGAVIENLTMERLGADPVPVSAGRLWYNTTDKVIKYSSLDAGGAVIVEVIATGASAAALASRVTTLEGLVQAIGDSYINKDGSVAFTGDQSMGGNKLTNVAAPVAGTDAANKDFVISSIQSLGNAFEYVGGVVGGADAANAFALGGLAKKQAGAYYKVTTAGYFAVGELPAFYANVGDGLVFNVDGAVDKIDNTDSNVQGTADYITVTGSADTGFTVDLAAAAKGRLVAVEEGLADEIDRATGVEAGLDTRLTTAEGNITTLQGQAGTLASDLAAEVTRATNAEAANATAIANEITRATTAEGANATAIANEITRATNAEGVIAGDLAAEVTRATAAEGANATAIANEVTRATTAEGAIDTKIGNLASLTTSDKTSIVNAINNLQVLAGGGTDALKSAINAQKFTFQAGAPALTHVITHNLNTAFPNVDIRVRGDDGVYRNDIVAFEETDANTITVYMTEARLIKASIQKMEALA